MEISPEVQLAIDREIAKVREEARREAEKGRNQAIGVLGFVALLLTLASGLGVSSMIKSYSNAAVKEAVGNSTFKDFIARAETAALSAEDSSSKTNRFMSESSRLLGDLKAVEGWVDAPLEPGWQHSNAEPGLYSPPGYYRDAFSIVRLRGLVRSGRHGTILILPPGYRPKFRQIFTVLAGGNGYGRVDVLSNGQVELVSGDSSWISLDSISFRSAGGGAK